MLSVVNALILSALLFVYTFLSRKIRLDSSILFGESERSDLNEVELNERKEEMTKKQLKRILIMLPTMLLIIYGLYWVGFPIIFIFFGMSYLAFFLAVPSLIFLLDLPRELQYLLTLCMSFFPVAYILMSFFKVPTVITFLFYNFITLTLCFSVLLLTFSEVGLNDKIFLQFFVLILLYDIIVVWGVGILVEIVQEVGREAQREGMWLFPPIFLILPGPSTPVFLGLGDIFLLGLVFIKIKRWKNLLFLLLFLFPIFILTFSTVFLFDLALPASFLGVASFLFLKFLRKTNMKP
ncbi:MAG: hypothetical protein GWO20_07365 [Candidatus Korarchaeota archaeon]|nr:hypothetical protein [Candidatus Korarchaeota archaeon]NIW13610.1 hypothetical protein [Candidatus Thorarchaeota archaeon]